MPSAKDERLRPAPLAATLDVVPAAPRPAEARGQWLARRAAAALLLPSRR